MRFSFRLLPRICFTAIILVFMTLILGLSILLISLFTSSGVPTYRIMVSWARVVSWSMRLTFSIHGAEKIVPNASYIVTPNHQGNADILALLVTLPLRFRWVIKKELLRIPIFGQALAGTGAISIDRSDAKKAVKSLKQGIEKLKDGWSVLIYPEGTRSSDEKLQHFKKGPFMMAVQTGVPILPVTCNGAFRILPKKTVFFHPGHIEVRVGDPIVTEGLSEEDVPALMEKTRDAILANLDINYDPFEPGGHSET